MKIAKGMMLVLLFSALAFIFIYYLQFTLFKLKVFKFRITHGILIIRKRKWEIDSMNMTNVKKILFAFLTLIVFPAIVKGEECPLETLDRLRAYAISTEIRYSYLKDNDLDNKFSVSINNLNDNFIVLVKDNSILFKYDIRQPIPSTITIDQFQGGNEYIFEYYVVTENACKYELLITRRLYLPKFNIYSKSDLCNGIEEYKLCDMWYSGPDISEEDFIYNISKYRREKEEKDIDQNLLPENTWDKLFDVASQNYWLLLVLFASFFVLIYLTVGLVQRRRKSL